MKAREQAELTLEYDGRVKVAKAFSIDSLIPAKVTGKPVVLRGWDIVRRCTVTVLLGSVAKNRENDDGDGLCPGVDVDLWQLILVLLSIWRERPLGSKSVHPSMNEVWRRFSGSKTRPSVNQRRTMAELWERLDTLRMIVQYPGEPGRGVDVVHYDTARIKLNTGLTCEMAVEGFSFDIRFLNAVIYAHECLDVRLDVLSGITSNFVRAAYLWLPSRALARPVRESELPRKGSDIGADIRIGLVKVRSSELFQRLGMPNLPRWDRKGRLCKNACSILDQLHGLPLLKEGLHLGVCSWDEEDDFYLGLYTYTSGHWKQYQPRQRPEAGPRTKLAKWFVEQGGGSIAAYMHWINHAPLPKPEEYQIDRLARMGVENLDGSMTFFRMCIALLGPDEFKDVVNRLSEAKVSKSASGLFRTLLLTRVAEKAKKRTEQYVELDVSRQFSLD